MSLTGNYVGLNYGRNPLTGFNFMLRVEGIWDIPCRSVRAFTKENEYEYIQEGGLNDYVHMRRKPISKPFTFQVEQYAGVHQLFDPLANGTELVLPVILTVHRYHLQGNAHPMRMYIFTGCTVISKEYGELNAEKSGLVTEITTIAYREMVTMDMAFSSNAKDPWSPEAESSDSDNAAPAFMGSNRSAKINKKEERKNEREKAHKKWRISGSSYKGTDNSARYTEKERRKAEAIEAAEKWPNKSRHVKIEDYLKNYKSKENKT